MKDTCPPTPPPSGRTTPENYEFMVLRREDESMLPQENGHGLPHINDDSTTTYQQIGWRRHALPMFVWVLIPSAEGEEQWSIVWLPEYHIYNVPMYIPDQPLESQTPDIPREDSE